MDFLGLPRDEKEGEELGVEAPARAMGEASSSLVGDPPNNLTCVTGMRTCRLWNGAQNWPHHVFPRRLEQFSKREALVVATFISFIHDLDGGRITRSTR